MIDLPSVKVSGAFNIARARVLWKEGKLKAFTKDGVVLELVGVNRPTPNKGWRRSWRAETPYGDITMSAKCSTCGGWRRVTQPTAEELWG